MVLDSRSKFFIGFGSYLGIATLDEFWDALKAGTGSVLNQSGRMGNTVEEANVTLVDRTWTTFDDEATVNVTGVFHAPPETRKLEGGEGVHLVMVFEETLERILFFRVDMDKGFLLQLPQGLYSFYGFFMDLGSEKFLDARIFAAGFPGEADREEAPPGEFDMGALGEDRPLEIKGTEMQVDFMLGEAGVLLDCPAYFGEIYGDVAEAQALDVALQLSGVWRLHEIYDFGEVVYEVYLVQFGCKIAGLLLLWKEDGTLTLYQKLLGGLDGEVFSLSGDRRSTFEGGGGGYGLSDWTGEVAKEGDRISGKAENLAGAVGSFTMDRLA